MFGVEFVIRVLQDSAETALNGSTDTIFTSAVAKRMNLINRAKVVPHLLCLFLMLSGVACERSQQPSTPEVLRVGVLPDLRADTLKRKYEPLTTYLSEELGQDVQLIIPEDYADLVRLFGKADVDIAYFGGATFVSAENQYQAVPLVMRDIDTRFTSYFLARSDAKGSQISDFEGRAIGFGSPLSTSGHYMPRFFLQEQAIDPETFFNEVTYSGAHDRTVELLLEGRIDLGAVNSEVVDSMLRQGQLDANSLKVIWETPVYADYVWAVQPGWNEAYINRVRDAFLRLSLSDERDSKILQNLGAGGFLPATPGDFFRLRAIVLRKSGTDNQIENQAN